jgi:hypothetical protein
MNWSAAPENPTSDTLFMNRNDIVPGTEYALRETHGQDLQRVRVVEHVRRGRWRVEWLEPNAGLVDFVRSGALVCRWADRKSFERDERRDAEVRAVTDRSWPGPDHPLDNAVNEILETTGEDLWLHRGVLSGAPDAIDRVAGRAHYELHGDTAVYTDRPGRRHAPWPVALELAKRFAAAEPRTVLARIEADERKWEVEAREPGNSHVLALLERYRAAWALVRQWASFDADRARLDAEIERLRQLVTRAMWDLRTPDADPQRIAGRLERGLRGD